MKDNNLYQKKRISRTSKNLFDEEHKDEDEIK